MLAGWKLGRLLLGSLEDDEGASGVAEEGGLHQGWCQFSRANQPSRGVIRVK